MVYIAWSLVPGFLVWTAWYGEKERIVDFAQLARTVGRFYRRTSTGRVMMSSASRSGHPVGYEGFFYLLVSPFVGAAGGVMLCNALEKGSDFEDLE